MKLGNEISAVVAGGAKGLGAAAAEKLANAGCKVAILDMYREEGEALAKKIGAIYRHLEISSEITVDTALDFAREENGIERILVKLQVVQVANIYRFCSIGRGLNIYCNRRTGIDNYIRIDETRFPQFTQVCEFDTSMFQEFWDLGNIFHPDVGVAVSIAI